MTANANEVNRRNLNLRTLGTFFVNWYLEGGRDFPWRKPNVGPFAILTAEILLKQTRAEMVAQVWPSLIKRYPDATALSNAQASELFEILAGLGFGHQRTQALLEVSAAILGAGAFPCRIEKLMQLPHVGLYASHAVACFGFNQRVPVVDLNVVRVLSRFSGIEPPKDIRRAAPIWGIALALLPDRNVVEHNYGLLDFAAMICRARSPRCNVCPISSGCAYYGRELPSDVQLLRGTH